MQGIEAHPRGNTDTISWPSAVSRMGLPPGCPPAARASAYSRAPHTIGTQPTYSSPWLVL